MVECKTPRDPNAPTRNFSAPLSRNFTNTAELLYVYISHGRLITNQRDNLTPQLRKSSIYRLFSHCTHKTQPHRLLKETDQETSPTISIVSHQ